MVEIVKKMNDRMVIMEKTIANQTQMINDMIKKRLSGQVRNLYHRKRADRSDDDDDDDG